MIRLWIVLISVALVSCSSTQTPPAVQNFAATSPSASPDASGAYVLKTIDGNPLPTRPNDPDRPPEAGPGPLVVGGSLVIERGGQARYVLNFRGARGRENSIRMNASLERLGDQQVLVWPNGAKTPVKFDGHTFSIDNIGMKLVFERTR